MIGEVKAIVAATAPAPWRVSPGPLHPRSIDETPDFKSV